MIRIVALVALVLSLAACGGRARREAVAFDGHIFRAKASTSRDDRRAMVIAVSPVSASVAGAREAGRYEATKYCMINFGSSNTEWDIGPDAPDTALAIVDDTLTLRGRCTG